MKGRIAGERISHVTPTGREHYSRLQQSRCRAVIDDVVIPFAAYTAAETFNAYQ